MWYGYDAEAATVGLAEAATVRDLAERAAQAGPVTRVVLAGGVSPSQAPVETILRVDLYGTAVALEEMDGPRGAGYRRQLELSPAGRAGAPDEIAALAGFLMGPEAGYVNGADILADGGVTASWYYGPLSQGGAN